jgi:hypothetical protein
MKRGSYCLRLESEINNICTVTSKGIIPIISATMIVKFALQTLKPDPINRLQVIPSVHLTTPTIQVKTILSWENFLFPDVVARIKISNRMKGLGVYKLDEILNAVSDYAKFVARGLSQPRSPEQTITVLG